MNKLECYLTDIQIDGNIIIFIKEDQSRPVLFTEPGGLTKIALKEGLRSRELCTKHLFRYSGVKNGLKMLIYYV